MSSLKNLNPDQAMTARELAVQAELTDTRNWIDDFAVPVPVRAALSLARSWQGDPAIVRSKIRFRHFNLALAYG